MADPHETLQEVTKGAVRELAGKVAELSQATHEELSRDGSLSLPEVLAALEIIGKIAQAEKEILAEHGGVIFPDGKTEPSLLVTEEETETGVVAEAGEKQPKTFGELLRTKIEEALPEQDTFGMDDVVASLPSKRGLGKVIDNFGWGNKKNFDREEALTILEETLKRPTSPSFVLKETYSIRGLVRSFPPLTQSEVNGWGEQIGWSFKEHPEVGMDEAFAIRGLAAFKRVTDKK